jgi:hypothetical protein
LPEPWRTKALKHFIAIWPEHLDLVALSINFMDEKTKEKLRLL